MMMMFLAAAAGAAGTLPRPLYPSEKARILEAVSNELRDPMSAQFGWPPLTDQHVYCGTVNAKNGYGGYVGRRPFAVFLKADGGLVKVDGGRSVMLAGGDRMTDELIVRACSDPTKDGRVDAVPLIR